MKRIVCNLETIAKTFLSVAGSIFGLIAIITAFISWDDLQISVKQRIRASSGGYFLYNDAGL